MFFILLLTRELDLRSKNKKTQLSETELSRLGQALKGVTGYILRRTLVDSEGVRLVDRIASSGSYKQYSEALAIRTSRILAKDRRDILLMGLQPYVQNVDADICDDTPSKPRATNGMNPLTLFSSEQSTNILKLRKYRSWITEEGGYHQAVQNPSEVPPKIRGLYASRKRYASRKHRGTEPEGKNKMQK